MKLSKLVIEGLYGYYNYDVDFNEDVTFLYGLNGCGKTTVLDIIEDIITGKLFELFKYKFKNIRLYYYNGKHKPKDIKKHKNIIIKRVKNDEIEVFFDNKRQSVKDINYRIREFESFSDDIPYIYYEKYKILTEIREAFGHIYLPLNRANAFENLDDFYFTKLRYQKFHKIHDESERNNQVIFQVSKIISRRFSEINSQITEINNRFRNRILKSLLEFHEYNDVQKELFNIFGEEDVRTSLEKIHVAYIEMLKSLNLLNPEEVKEMDDFFTSFVIDLQKISKRKNGVESSDDGEIVYRLLQKLKEVVKMKRLLEISEETASLKEKAEKPLVTFKKIMNEFISYDVDEKKIKIDSFGRVYFTNKYSKHGINVDQLSSGEKQLLTFFAILILGARHNKNNIFIVDEPEISLHLLWQKNFVDKALEVNPNIQLIFATHSPEFIGRRRDKMFELKKQCIGDGKDNG